MSTYGHDWEHDPRREDWEVEDLDYVRRSLEQEARVNGWDDEYDSMVASPRPGGWDRRSGCLSYLAVMAVVTLFWLTVFGTGTWLASL